MIDVSKQWAKLVLTEFQGEPSGFFLSVSESFGCLRRREEHSAESAASGAVAIPRSQAIPVITAVVSGGLLLIVPASGD
jgi:hypothetical protein